MLTVYGRASSSNVQAVRWELEELQPDYTRLDYGESHGGLDRPEFRAMSPHGKIPVLRDGDTAIWETPAILRNVAANLAIPETEQAKAEDQLARHDFVCADALTLADIQFGHVLFRYFDMDMQRATLPKLRAHYDRLAHVIHRRRLFPKPTFQRAGT